MGDQTEWLRCPVCGSKTRLQVTEDTVILNFPLFCPKCKQERLISMQQFQIIILSEPDAEGSASLRRRAGNS